MLNTIRRWLGWEAKEKPVLPPWRVIFGTSAPTDKLSDIVPTPSETDLYNCMRFHAVVFACIRLITSCVGIAPLKARIDGEDTELDQLDMIRYGLDCTENDFIGAMVSSYLVCGAGYAIKIRKQGELYNLAYCPSTLITPVASNVLSPSIKHYLYGEKPLKPENVLVFRHYNPADPADESMSPLRACYRELHLDEQRVKYWTELLRYTPVPGMLISNRDDNMMPKSVDVIDKVISQSAIGRRGGAVYLPFPVDTTNFGKDFSDSFNWESFTMAVEPRICAAFGVPPQLLGIESGLRYSTYSNYKEARKAFLNQTIQPIWSSLGAALTRSLCSQEGDIGVDMVFDTSNIPELEDHADEVELLGADIIDRNEARERLGFEAVDETKENNNVSDSGGELVGRRDDPGVRDSFGQQYSG
jgi:HK97 family phage portal protein